jgi:hypothetical protein
VCTLAAALEKQHMPCAAVVLQSPYASIRDVAADLLGCISFCMLNRWDNAQHLVGTHDGVIRSPVFFIHADQDKVINCNHSQLLFEHRKKAGLPCEFFLQKSTATFTKGHNFFDYVHDVVVPTKGFLGRHLAATDSRFGNTMFTLPNEVVARVSAVPRQYEPEPEPDNSIASQDSRDSLTMAKLHRPRQHSSSEDTSIFKHPKCSWDIYCGFACCPCVMCSEACCALNYLCCTKTYFCVSGTQPQFEYGLLKPQSNDGSVCNLLRRKNSFDEGANQPKPKSAAAATTTTTTAATTTTTTVAPGSKNLPHNKQRRHSGDNMVNPLLSHNFDTLPNVDANLEANAERATCPVTYTDGDSATASDTIEVNFLPG